MIPRAKRRPLDPTSWKKLGMVTGQVWHIHGENVMVVDVDVDGVTFLSADGVGTIRLGGSLLSAVMANQDPWEAGSSPHPNMWLVCAPAAPDPAR